MPSALKSGIESLSNMPMDEVRVHYNSSRPEQLNAAAYAQGKDIHLAPGQEHHLPHEAWHVVQQAQGRVRATRQGTQGVLLNEDEGLEREADAMGARAAAAGNRDDEAADAFAWPLQRNAIADEFGPPVQRVKGGLEYTENNSTLDHYAGGNGMVAHQAAPATVAIGARTFCAYHLPLGDPALGARHAWDGVVWTNGLVSLTNDTHSPEWIIAAHNADITRGQMGTQISTLFAMRSLLRNALTPYRARYPGEQIAIIDQQYVAGAIVTPDHAYVYTMAATSNGSAQITLKYRDKETVKRIAEVNIASRLTGGAIDDDRRYLGRRPDQRWGDWFSMKFTHDASSLARTMREQLSAQSDAIAAGGVTYLTAGDVGVVKMMIISDALAATIVRFNALFGQSRDKNQQRFFPKSRRPEYVHAMAQRAVPNAALLSLRAHLGGQIANMRATLKRDFNYLSVDWAVIAGAVAPATQVSIATAIADTRAGTATAQQHTILEQALFGIQDAVIDAHLQEVCDAYSEPVGGPDAHTLGHREAVVKSMTYADVDPNVEPGAVYELRNREVPMGEGNLGPINAALDQLMGVA